MVTLAPSGVRHDPSLEKVRPAGKDQKLPFRTRNHLKIREIEDVPARKKQYSPQRSQKLLQGLRGYPREGRSRDPTETRPSEEHLLEHKRSSRASGATVEDINRGYPNQHP